MNKKQKKTLYRIIAAVVLVLILKLLPQFPTPVELALYCIPYLVVGWDVLRKALLGIKNRQPFDECFLMAVATWVPSRWATTWKAAPLHLLPDRRTVPERGRGQEPPEHFQPDGHPPGHANVEDEDGKLEQVDPDDVEVGTVIVVQPGERVPLTV